jgi:hypothetical protein
VSSNKKIVIKDACILFDLVDLNLLEDFFQLELFAITTPEVIAEITNEIQWTEISKYVESEKLVVDDSGVFQSIADLFDEYPGLSIADSSVLELAIRKDAIIFSSDGSLRKISINKNLTVRGILWIIEELLNRNVIDIKTALEKLNNYATINQRAPVKEIQILIKKLSK